MLREAAGETERMDLLDIKAASENVVDLWKKHVQPAVDRWLKESQSFVADTIQSFRDEDARKMVESVRGAIDPMVRDATQNVLDQVKDRAPGIGETLVAGAESRVNGIVNGSIRTTFAEARATLAKESPLIQGIERTVGKVNQTIDHAKGLIPRLRELTGLNDPDASKKTMQGLKDAAQDLKEFVTKANSLVPEIAVVLREYHAEKERERDFNWRVVLGSTAAGLLLVTFAYALYLKFGLKMTPVRAISLFWLGVSTPIIVLNLKSLATIWWRARKHQMLSEVHRHIFVFKNIANLVVLLVLVAANLVLNLWLARPSP